MFEHCEQTFTASQTIRLTASPEVRHIYPYQDLMIGTCNRCGHTVMQWQGVDEFDIRGQIYSIRPKHFDKWMIRSLTDKVQDINEAGHTADWVMGSNLEFPWELRMVRVTPAFDPLTGNEVTGVMVGGEVLYCA